MIAVEEASAIRRNASGSTAYASDALRDGGPPVTFTPLGQVPSLPLAYLGTRRVYGQGDTTRTGGMGNIPAGPVPQAPRITTYILRLLLYFYTPHHRPLRSLLASLQSSHSTQTPRSTQTSRSTRSPAFAESDFLQSS